MKKIFIAGGAGFIGSQLADKLIADGNYVTVYDNLSSGKESFIKQNFGNGNFSFVRADIEDLDKLKQNIIGHDIVFQLAANPDIRYGIEHTDADLKQNTICTYNILEAMRLTGINKIVFSSTSTIYGEPTVMPTPEEYGPLYPISLYGASKLACEALCTAFSHTFNMQCWIFRFANIVGGRGTHGLLYDFIKKLKQNANELEILGNGRQVKSYLLVDDCIDAMLYACKNSNDQFNVYNLGCGDQIDITMIAKLLNNKMGLNNAKLKLTGGDRGWPGDVAKMDLDVRKINKLGWKSKYSSREAVEIAIDRMLNE
jgi:UDP-glucose 4-epimerase